MFGSSVQFKGDLQHVWEGKVPRVKEVVRKVEQA